MIRWPQAIPAKHLQVVQRVVAVLADMPHVVGVTLGGSTSAGLADASSDLDLHVYWQPPLAPSAEREALLANIADAGSLHIGVQSWGLEDHLEVERCPAELIFLQLDELRAHIERAYTDAFMDEGYVTAQLYSSYHPGEKRLIQHLQHCAIQPPSCAKRWLHTATLAADDPTLADALGSLITDLITLIKQDGSVQIADYAY